jgi:hypothetical protein
MANDTGATELGKEYPGSVRKKHRHDLGHEDHGPKLAAHTTRGIQILLGLWIVLTMLFVVYAVVDASRPKGPAADYNVQPKASEVRGVEGVSAG